MNAWTKEGTMVAHLYHISDPGAFGVKHSGRIEGGDENEWRKFYDFSASPI